ncbi:MAG TPA: hypothetical protein VI968_03765 [archaeon]|nr:hypothetical protein [archaeon]
MPIVSLKVDEKTKKLMEMHDEINWSAVIRKNLEKKLEEMQKSVIDKERAKKACEDMDMLRKKHKNTYGKQGEDIVREWRDKRKL